MPINKKRKFKRTGKDIQKRSNKISEKNLCFLKHLFVNYLYRPLQNIRRMTNKKVSNRLETMRVYLSFQWQYLFLETHSFPQNCFRTKCSPLVMDDLCEPVFWYIFAPNRGWYLCNLAYLIKCIHGKTPINIFTVLTIRRVWMRGCICQLSVKISAIYQFSIRFWAICQFSVKWLLPMITFRPHIWLNVKGHI